MASIPGYNLEAFVTWLWDLVVLEQGEANVSVGIAEMIGNVKPRPLLTQEQFAPLLELYEPHREKIEELLLDFDEEEHGSWRTYGCVVEDYLDPDIHGKAATLLQSVIEAS